MPSLLLVLVVAAVYWPALSSDWIRDDYLVMAFSRMLSSPWALFVTDHFHVPGSHFRPLTYAAFWASQAMLGNAHAGQAVVEGLIHLAVTLALYRLMRLGVSRVPALFGALLFGVHPAIITAAAWYSDRSGHLMLLFTLLALIFALDERLRWNVRIAAAATSLLASMLSKESGLVGVPIVMVVWWLDGDDGRRRAIGFLSVAAVTALFLIWRSLVLGTVTANLQTDASLLDLVGRGIAVWSVNFFGYATLWPLLQQTAQLALVALGALMVVVLYAGIRRHGKPRLPQRSWHLLVVAGMLIVLPGVLQAPVAAQNALPVDPSNSAVELAMQARLYYMPLAGVALALSVAIDLAWRAPGHPYRVALVACGTGLSLAVIAAGSIAMNDYRVRSVEIGGLARRAFDALAGHDLPRDNCKILYVGIERPPEWQIYVSMDSVVKALAPDIDSVARCLVSADYETFFNILPPPQADYFAATIGERIEHGASVPVRRVGTVAFAHLPLLPSQERCRDALVLTIGGSVPIDRCERDLRRAGSFSHPDTSAQ